MGTYSMRTSLLLWLISLAFQFITVSANVVFSASKPNNEWWPNTIIYQVYPRSFRDSNKDGIGDLKGITQKLDHFVDIGVETLWIGPLFKSPMDDMGYDVEYYKMIDPIFGTMDDFAELVVEMTKRNLKLITDLIPNHTSYKCEWFEKSVRREGKYTDYYMWKDAKNQAEVLKYSTTPIPPNNWLSVFGGSAWAWHAGRKQFYYHQFSVKQPELNIRNLNVQNELFDVMEFWMDRGVTGFRFDALRHLFESTIFDDEPYLPGKENSTYYYDMVHVYTCDQPETLEMIYTWRKFLDDYNSRKNSSTTKLLTSESYTKYEILMKYYGNTAIPGAQVPFNFGLLLSNKINLIESIDQSINTWLSGLPENAVPNWVIENHDNFRIATKFGPQMVQVLTALKLALPGVDVTYYGSEIGMENVFIRPDQKQDPNEDRDCERSPMQWDDSTNAGFTEATKPWLPVHPNYYKLNVKSQKQIPTSNYNFFKRMSQLRKTDTLKYGDLRTYNISKSIYIVKRSLPEHESYVVVMNFGSETETVNLSDTINDIKDDLYVYLASENSVYSEGSVVPTSSTAEKPFQLRPQCVVVLTDKRVATKAKPSRSSGRNSIQTGSTLASLISVLLVLRLCL